MPSISKKQHNLMAAVANNPQFAKKVGIKQSVGKDFMEADKGKKFGTGGDVNYTYGGKGQINKQRTRGGSIYGVQKNIPNENLNKYIGKKEGGEVNKLFKGKETPAEEKKEAKALKSGKISKAQYVAGEKSEGHGKGAAKKASAIKTGKLSPAKYAAEHAMKKGGKCMAKGGLAAGHKSADGCATKGKTKARAVTMKKGGKC
jgi:hypothetical protein